MNASTKAKFRVAYRSARLAMQTMLDAGPAAKSAERSWRKGLAGPATTRAAFECLRARAVGVPVGISTLALAARRSAPELIPFYKGLATERYKAFS